MSNLQLEICVDSIESALAAQAGGAARVELCGDLSSGGTTPGAGMVALARKVLHIGLHVMIRPRGGDFCYSDAEFEVMKRDIVVMKQFGANAVVFGLLAQDNNIDIPRTRELVDLARPMKITFHRAFDLVMNPMQALEEIIALGIERILISGQQSKAIEGLSLIKQLVQTSAGRASIMPGSGITAENVNAIIQGSDAREIHVCSGVSDLKEYPNAGIFNAKRHIVNEEKVRNFVNSMK